MLQLFPRRMFEGVVNYCSFHGNVIPLSFVLGFYVTVVMNRWWNQYTTIPWPDSIAVFVSATIHGQVCTKPTISPRGIVTMLFCNYASNYKLLDRLYTYFFVSDCVYLYSLENNERSVIKL